MCPRPSPSTWRRRWATAPNSSPGASRSAARTRNSSASGSTASWRWSRNEDVLDDRNKRAFLCTPREKFVLKQNEGRAYDHAFLDIGWGVTISGPHIVGRMTTTINPQKGEKVLGDRHRLRLPVGLSLAPDRSGVHDRDHQAAGRAHPRHLRRADQGRLRRVQGDHLQERRRLLRLGGARARSTRSSSPAASTTFRRRCCSSSRTAARW